MSNRLVAIAIVALNLLRSLIKFYNTNGYGTFQAPCRRRSRFAMFASIVVVTACLAIRVAGVAGVIAGVTSVDS